ncbi:hypothetical protein D3C80_1499130 [compost metagenome]
MLSAVPNLPATGSAFAGARRSIFDSSFLIIGSDHGIRHQHGNRHRTDAPGHRRNGACNRQATIEVNITQQLCLTCPPLSRVNAVDTHIDNSRARLHSIGFHHLGAPYCGDEDVRIAADGAQVACP